MSDEQKSSYAAEFEKDYEDYVKLKKREKEVCTLRVLKFLKAKIHHIYANCIYF